MIVRGCFIALALLLMPFVGSAWGQESDPAPAPASDAATVSPAEAAPERPAAPSAETSETLPETASPSSAADASGTAQDVPPAAQDHPEGEDEIRLGSPQSELRRARNSFEYGNYQDVVERLEMGLAQDIFTNDQLVDVYRMLGLSYYITGDAFKAKQAFLSLLRLEPEFEMNPLFIHPDIIDLFEAVREENAKELQQIVRKRLGIEEDKPKDDSRVVRYNPYWVNFIPFGAGQFQNRDYAKGGLFLGFETALLALNLTGYGMLRQTQGEDGYFATKDLNKAQAWRITQYASFGALVLLAVGGVVDAVLHWNEYDVIEAQAKPEPSAGALAPELSGRAPSADNGFSAVGGWSVRF